MAGSHVLSLCTALCETFPCYVNIKLDPGCLWYLLFPRLRFPESARIRIYTVLFHHPVTTIGQYEHAPSTDCLTLDVAHSNANWSGPVFFRYATCFVVFATKAALCNTTQRYAALFLYFFLYYLFYTIAFIVLKVSRCACMSGWVSSCHIYRHTWAYVYYLCAKRVVTWLRDRWWRDHERQKICRNVLSRSILQWYVCGPSAVAFPHRLAPLELGYFFFFLSVELP